MKILVVDDDALQRKVIEQTLIKGGYDLVVHTNAIDAKKVLEEEKDVRFVITDWMMPGLDGPSFVRWIRSANITGYVYVMLLTARESPDDIENGLNAGADDYIKKPSNPRELLARVAVGERILHLEENLRAVSERLERQALIDDLTGLMNRRAIYQVGRQEIIRASRSKTSLSMLFLDLDKFKQINDTHGHLAGDEALKLAARLLMRNIREYDQAGRWAGDEFIGLLPNTSMAQSMEVGMRVLRAFRHSALTLEKGAKVVLNASIGMYTWTPGDWETINIDALVRLADLAMYQAKQAGGDQAVSYTDVRQK